MEGQTEGASRVPVLELFAYLRHRYLRRVLGPRVRSLLQAAGVEEPPAPSLVPEKLLLRTTGAEEMDWGDVGFHLSHRCKTAADMSEWFGTSTDFQYVGDLIAQKGYLLSILPLNALLPREAVNQFIPPRDFSVPHELKDIDPYGIASDDARIDCGELWVGSEKFAHTVLVNTHGECPLGCSDCYKSIYTRERQHGRTLGASDAHEQTPFKLILQAESLVNQLNDRPDVYDVIVSGGEPLIRPNSHIAALLDRLRGVRHLRVLRICTGTVFLGLPFRIDEELLDLLVGFSQATGARVTFQTHLSNHFQITPEAVMAVSRIRSHEISLYSQTPIKEGVNFFSGDLAKTTRFLKELVTRQFLVGVEPYKFIVDMHPRTLAYYVPIELLATVFSALFDSHDLPDLLRPKALSLLSRQGNVVLSWHSLFAMTKEIDRNKGIVTYRIPKVRLGSGGPSASTYVCREPLMPANDNPDSLRELRREAFPEGEVGDAAPSSEAKGQG